jgi:hypothetical protein
MTASGKQQFEHLREAFIRADVEARNEIIAQSVKYGTERSARQHASRGEKTRLEKLESKRDKVGNQLVELVVAESPRGETWKSGAPVFWMYRDLPWEDVIQPKDQPLPVLPPAPFGWSEEDVRRHFNP